MSNPQAKGQQSIHEMIEEQKKKTAKKETKTEVKKEEKVEVKDARFEKIEENEFFQVIFSKKTLEEKRTEIKQLLIADPANKDANEKRLEAFRLFQDYMQEERKNMQVEIIQLTDTGVFGVLKSVIDDMNKGVTEFENSMRPLTDIVGAVYKLRNAGLDVTNGIVNEIQKDREAEEGHAQKIKDNERRIAEMEASMRSIDGDIAILKNKRSMFGLFGPKQSDLEEATRKEVEKNRLAAEAAAMGTDLMELRKGPKTDTQYAEFAEEKAKLRTMLDISREDHQKQQKRLVDAALNFVATSDARVAEIMTSFGDLKDRLKDIDKANSGTQSIYAIMTDAAGEASKENQAIISQYQVAKEGEGLVEKMKRETAKKILDEHIGVLSKTTVDTARVFSEVVQDDVKIKTMRDANAAQIDETRNLKSDGIARIASNLSITLTTLNSAAISESSMAAKQSMNLLNEKTNKMLVQEVFKNAMGVNDTNSALLKTIEELANVGEVTRTATSMVADSYAKIEENTAILKKTIAQTQADIDKLKEVQTKVKESALKADFDAANDDKKKAAGEEVAPTGAKKPRPRAADLS